MFFQSSIKWNLYQSF